MGFEPIQNLRSKNKIEFMKNLIKAQTGGLILMVITLGLLLAVVGPSMFKAITLEAQAQDAAAPTSPEVADTGLDLKSFEARLPDQSHDMQDAGYHFANLWFAGDKQNWPLASYYLRKTRSYLESAVAIKPVRKTTAGTEVDLKGILDAVDHGMLAQMDKAIGNKDVAAFKTAYQQTIEGCNACHTACERQYIHLQVPNAPAASFIDFEPPPSKHP
jgi:hypothetical protein